ncbi:Acetylornithine aminotransferase [Musa troglodytarum]|uniref:Acetylornithine aminotransferase n=1 Tax=Musa troglodytarum TaxID=320322 RepID=A0A9E7ENR8_9LILI|nr:Acetylornithine aminotransferase [Musa troglodytarum]
MNSLQATHFSLVFPARNLPRVFELDRGNRFASRVKPPKVSSCLVSDAQQKVEASLEPASRESKEVMEMERNVFVGTYARAPVVIKSGRGCKLYDVDGKEYLDMTAGIAVNSLGHGDQDWLNAVVEQANTLTHVSNVYYSIPQGEGGIYSATKDFLQALRTACDEAGALLVFDEVGSLNFCSHKQLDFFSF